jgi:putative flippase GtrA
LDNKDFFHLKQPKHQQGNSLRQGFREFFLPKFKFALTSSVATLLDYGVYIALTLVFLVNESVSHAVSYTVAMVLNFLLQRRFIFDTNRKVMHVFGLSVMFSLIGWVLSQGLFNLLIHTSGFFRHYDILAKMLTTATIFLYNFYTKRFSFEKKYPLENLRKSFREKKN